MSTYIDNGWSQLWQAISTRLAFLRNGLSGSVAIDDCYAEEDMRLLAQDDIISGESGAAGLAGLLYLLSEKNEVLGWQQSFCVFLKNVIFVF